VVVETELRLFSADKTMNNLEFDLKWLDVCRLQFQVMEPNNGT